MQIERPKRITSESLAPEIQPAAEVVGNAVNTFMEQAYTAIMGKLGVTDNLNMEFKTIDITVNANGIPINNVSFKTGISTKIMGLTVIRSFLANPIAQPFLNFTENLGIVTITYATGLVPNTKYQLVILSIGA